MNEKQFSIIEKLLLAIYWEISALRGVREADELASDFMDDYLKIVCPEMFEEGALFQVVDKNCEGGE